MEHLSYCPVKLITVNQRVMRGHTSTDLKDFAERLLGIRI